MYRECISNVIGVNMKSSFKKMNLYKILLFLLSCIMDEFLGMKFDIIICGIFVVYLLFICSIW